MELTHFFREHHLLFIKYNLLMCSMSVNDYPKELWDTRKLHMSLIIINQVSELENFHVSRYQYDKGGTRCQNMLYNEIFRI